MLLSQAGVFFGAVLLSSFARAQNFSTYEPPCVTTCVEKTFQNNKICTSLDDNKCLCDNFVTIVLPSIGCFLSTCQHDSESELRCKLGLFLNMIFVLSVCVSLSVLLYLLHGEEGVAGVFFAFAIYLCGEVKIAVDMAMVLSRRQGALQMNILLYMVPNCRPNSKLLTQPLHSTSHIRLGEVLQRLRICNQLSLGRPMGRWRRRWKRRWRRRFRSRGVTVSDFTHAKLVSHPDLYTSHIYPGIIIDIT